MKKLDKLFFCMILTFGAILFCSSAHAQGEVSRSGSTWSARVNGNTVYTGSRMFDAVNAACNNMGAGTINIRNSGDSGPDGGSVYAIRPKANQTLDFHGHTVNCNGGDLIVVVHADKRDGITVRNLHVTGNPRYGLWFRGCSDVTISNITMNLSNNSPVGLGIRVDASTGPANNLTINGNINISGSADHAVETYGVNGFSIGNITANNTGGCALLLNDSRNGTVGVVTGNYNNQGGGYATFRVANNNGPNVSVEGVYSRNSGRGFFSVSGSHGTTIGWVDIANTSSHGIFLEDASNTHVLSGTVSNGNPNCQEVRTSGCTINVSGCGGSGGGGPSCGTCGSGIVNNGVYRITPRHATSKAVELYNFSSSNGTNVNQWEYWGGDYQHWRAIDRGNGYWSFHPVTATGRAMDVANISTADGANIALWDYWAGDGQQWYFSNAGSGGWVRIMSRLSGKCVDVVGSGDGANVEQWTCQSGFHNQMFRFEPASGGSSYSDSSSQKFFAKQDGPTAGFAVFPNPASDAVQIDFPSIPSSPAMIKLMNMTGQVIYEAAVSGSAYILDVASFTKGIYILSIEHDGENIKQKIVLE